MRKMDEMSRNIRLCSEGMGFKFLLLTLSAWTLFECYAAFFKSLNFNVIPVLLLSGALSVQGFYEIYLKRKMIADDEEYREPNKFIFGIVLLIATISILISVGYFISNM